MNDEDEVCTSRGSTLVCSRVECCVFAVCVCLSSKSRSGIEWLDFYLTYTYMCTNVCMYICTYTCNWYSINGMLKLSVVMEHQFYCLCCLSLPTGGVDSYLDCSSLWPSHCSTDTS